MKSILMSIKPKRVEKIASGEMSVVVLKSVPKCGTPFKVYIYCTNDRKETLNMANGKGFGKKVELYLNVICYYPSTYGTLNGKVVGEFVCDEIYNFIQAGAGIVFADQELCLRDPSDARDMTCLTDKEISDYLGNSDGYGLHISDLKIYDKPKELSEFHYPCTYPKNTCEECAIQKLKPHCHYGVALERPPQSWCYVEGL